MAHEPCHHCAGFHAAVLDQVVEQAVENHEHADDLNEHEVRIQQLEDEVEELISIVHELIHGEAADGDDEEFVFESEDGDEFVFTPEE